VSPANMSSHHNDRSSLTEVLGNDYLLWHMWKRRASVTPRGEEDIVEMRTMYETDPDMKLFDGRSWDLDPSDMNTASNADHTLEASLGQGSDRPITLSRERDPVPQHTSDSSDKRPSYLPLSHTTSSSSISSSSSSSLWSSEPPSPTAKLHRPESRPKRFSWGGRQHADLGSNFDLNNPGSRRVEVKKRKTLDDYEMRERESMRKET